MQVLLRILFACNWIIFFTFYLFQNEFFRERSESEKKRIENAENMAKILLKSVAKGYCMLILGLGSSDYHHMHCGK